MARVVILGAGLTGISTAYHLEQKGFFDYQLFEKEQETGGLCRSIVQDGFTFDYTGHLLHINDATFRSLIERIVGMDHFNSIQRRSCIYSQNTFTHYPYQMNLYGLPAATIISCIKEFVARPSIKKPRSFREWVLTNFGAGFGEHFFFPYQEKIFAHPIDQLTASWTQRFVPPTSLEQILQGSLRENQESVGYNAQFFYPRKGGIVSWVHALAAQLSNPIRTNFCVQRIDMCKKYILFTNGHVEPYETLVTTLPLDTFLSLTHEKSSSSMKRALPKLLCNQVINFNLGVRNPSLSEKHWIYFPESEFPFYRIGFPHNFTAHAAPPGCSSLYGEIAHIKKSPEWISETVALAIKKTKLLLQISDADIATQAVINIPHAYVIYDAWRDRNLPRLLSKLQEQQVHSIGRYGAWKYASMQEAILDGKQTADHLALIPARKDTTEYPVSHPSYQEYHEVR